MPSVQAVLREEIQRVARREIRSELEATKKIVSKQRSDIAELKRRSADLERKVSYLESRESKRLKAAPAKAEPPKGTRFSVRSLKAQRAKSGLSAERLRKASRRQRLDDLQLGERHDEARQEAADRAGGSPWAWEA